MDLSSATSVMSARNLFSRLLGLQANGRRDLYNVFGWKRQLEYKDFVAKYLRQDVAQRVIDAPVEALWVDPPAIVGDDAFNAAWNKLRIDHNVYVELMNVDRLAGLGKFAILMVGLDDGAAVDKPVRKGEHNVIYMQAYGEGSVTIREYDTDPRSPRFGLPVIYRVNPGKFEDQIGSGFKGTMTQSLNDFDVHWSRVLHVADGTLDSKVFGHSRLEPVYNALDDLLKITGGSAESFWLSANRGLHVNVDKEMELGKDDAEALSDEVEEYSNQLRRIIRTRGVEVKSLGAEIASPTGHFDVQMSLIAATTGIPKRVLMGSEAGQLASQQDRANWSQRVDERIKTQGEPIILFPFLRMMINNGVLPSPSKLTVEWPDTFKMNPLERAQTSAQMARSAANLAKMLSTVEGINQQIANAARPTIVSAGGGGAFGGGMKSMAKKEEAFTFDSTDDQPKATEGYGSASKDITKAPPGMIMRPPLIKGREPIELLTPEECRQIIGFGKHMPVFAEDNNSTDLGGKSSSSEV